MGVADEKGVTYDEQQEAYREWWNGLTPDQQEAVRKQYAQLDDAKRAAIAEKAKEQGIEEPTKPEPSAPPLTPREAGPSSSTTYYYYGGSSCHHYDFFEMYWMCRFATDFGVPLSLNIIETAAKVGYFSAKLMIQGAGAAAHALGQGASAVGHLAVNGAVEAGKLIANIGRGAAHAASDVGSGCSGLFSGCSGGGSSSSDSGGAAAILAIIAIAIIIAALVSVSLVGFVYAAKKTWNSLSNIVKSINGEGQKTARSVYRLGAIAAGAALGVKYGIVMGAIFGSAIPVIGTLFGGILGAIIGAGFMAAFGAIFAKYSAKAISYVTYGDTNPDKWKLSKKEIASLTAKDSQSDLRNSTHAQLSLKIMDAIDSAKRKVGGGEKTKLNHLLKEVKKGHFSINNNQIKMRYGADDDALSRLQAGGFFNSGFKRASDLNNPPAERLRAV